MTYFSVLAVFILPPILILYAITQSNQRESQGCLSRREMRRSLGVILLHVVLALVYTTPWDNYLVANGIWWYDPDLVIGLRLGWVPIEEYTFFISQTMLTGLWWVFVFRRDVPRHHPLPGFVRWAAALSTGLGWVFALLLWLSGWQPGEYLGLILIWALLPVFIQVIFGADILLKNLGRVVAVILVPTLYLWWVDSLSIASGTWTINPAKITGIRLGSLPLEEMVFFLMTNLIIAFGMTLMLAPESTRRASVGIARIKSWLYRAGQPPFARRARQ